jgi:hypothetical protein
MAVLYITEYAELSLNRLGQLGQMPVEPPVAEQTVAIGGSSVQSAAFNAATKFVRLHTDAICSVEVGANPTATATTGRLAANQTEFRDVSRGPSSGSAFKIAVITNT